MTVRELLEESRDCALYFREKREELEILTLQAANPLKRGLDEIVLELTARKKALDELAQEVFLKSKRAYALIGCLDDIRQKKALWMYYAYGLDEETAMRTAKCRSIRELHREAEAGIGELERLVTEIQKRREEKC